MKILGVFIQNYGSFAGRHYVPLADRGLVSVLGDNKDDPRARSNGAGKSTWSDALDWCLFGEHPRGDAAATVVTEHSTGGTTVTVQVLDDSGALVQVSRLRDHPRLPNGPRLYVDGVDKTALDAKETQVLIERTLGLDRTVFHAAVLFAQGVQWQFADGTDAERKELLTRILPELGEVDQLAERVDVLASSAAQEHVRQANNLAQETGRLEQLRVLDPSPRIAPWEAERSRALFAAREEHARSVQQLEQANHALEACGLTPTVPLHNPKPPALVEAQQQRLPSYDRALADGERFQGGLREQVRQLQKEIARLEDPRTTVCGSCGQPLTTAARSHVQTELATARDTLTETMNEGLRKKVELDGLRMQQAQLRAEIQGWEDAWRASNAEVERLTILAREHFRRREDLVEQVNRAAENATRRQMEVARIEAQVCPVHGEVARWQHDLAQQGQKVAGLTTQLEAVRKRALGLEFWKVGLGAKGLKSYLLDARLGEMAQEANRWVRLLTGGTTWVEFATQREVGKGKTARVREDFTVKVLRSNPDGALTSRAYRSWSGGEKHRIALGIDFGLARLVAKRASRAYDLLIMDEVFQHLDAAGKEAVAEMLTALSSEKSSIFVIDHDEQFQHLFDSKMVVQKRNRASHVVGGPQLIAGVPHAAFPE